MAGATFPARSICFPAEQIVRRLLRLEGVYNYQPEDLATALDFLSANASRFPFENLVGRVFPLDDVQVAFEFAESSRPPRVAIVCGTDGCHLPQVAT